MEYVEIARAESERGELVLRERRDEGAPPALELRANGVFVMDTVETSTERALAAAALALVEEPRAVVVGGLGLGFTMHEVLADPRVERCAVVEIEQALVDWMRDGTVPHGPALLADERVVVVDADVAVALAEARPASYDLVLLDVDNGPGYLVHEQNAGALHARPSSSAAAAALRPGRRAGGLVRRTPRPSSRRRCARWSATPRRGRTTSGCRSATSSTGSTSRGYRQPHEPVHRDPDRADRFRTEHDSMGEVQVPARRAVARADPARDRELPDQRHPPRAAAGPRARRWSRRAAARVNGELGILDRRAGRRRSRRPRRPSPPGEHDDAVPARRLPDRLRHQLEHEHQRGDRLAGRARRGRGAPQRPRQRQPVQQRHVPDRDPRRRDARRGRRPAAGPGTSSRPAWRARPRSSPAW